MLFKQWCDYFTHSRRLMTKGLNLLLLRIKWQCVYVTTDFVSCCIDSTPETLAFPEFFLKKYLLFLHSSFHSLRSKRKVEILWNDGLINEKSYPHPQSSQISLGHISRFALQNWEPLVLLRLFSSWILTWTDIMFCLKFARKNP